MELAVVIPTLNTATPLGRVLKQVTGVDRVVVADGGSEDGTLRVALRAGAVVASGSAGRGQQLHRGCTFALDTMGEDAWLLVFHADTVLPANWRELAKAHIREAPDRAAHFAYGADGSWWERAVLENAVRLRELAWGLPYGDQGLLLSGQLYREVGGYHAMSLFEDVDMVTRLKRHHGRLARLDGAVATDISAYRREGLFRRSVRNLALLQAYRHGESVEELAERYRTRR